MKSLLIILLAFLLCIPAESKKKKEVINEKGEIVKTGLSFGPLPAVAFDTDKGFQYGALLNIYNFGDGTHYPNPVSTWYLEASAYTKGSQWYVISYDAKYLIPGVRLCTALNVQNDTGLDFYGFNGYQSYYDSELHKGFYRHRRIMVRYKADFIGKIAKNFFWEAGYHFHYMKINEFTSKKYELDNTLYGMYTQWGIIPEDEKNGGFSSALRVGLMYDSRDIEASPSRGIWAEANFTAAPCFLGTSHPYNKLTATFRHYVPVVSDKLVFAYRIAYQGFFGDAPWYMLPFYNVVGPAYDRDGLGGYRTVRGPILNRIQGLQSGFYNAEFRWRFIDFKLWKQNIGLALNAFCDGAMVFKGMDLTNRTGAMPENYSRYVNTGINDRLHVAAGAGFRFIMNRNFIVALEFAQCTNRQDGSSSFYINTGYLF